MLLYMQITLEQFEYKSADFMLLHAAARFFDR